MKAIAVRQPWASLIICGVKTVENRSWATKYRGPLAIYASKATASKSDILWAQRRCIALGIDFPDISQTGGIIGVVDFADIIIPDVPPVYPAICTANDKAWYDWGSVGWILRNPRSIDFVMYKGQLGLFEIPGDLVDTFGADR